MVSYRQALLMSVPLGIIAAFAPRQAAEAQTLNLYQNPSSVFVPFALGSSPSGNRLVGLPHLSISLNDGTAQPMTMDTGSTGIIVSPDIFTPPANAISNGAGTQIYNSTGIKSTGTWYITDVAIHDPNSGAVLATANVPVLLVNSQTCLPHARNCTIVAGSTPSGVAMFGIGFGQEPAQQPQGVPANNPLLNITGLSGDGMPSHGYVLDTAGIQIGLTPNNTQGFAMVKLAPSTTASTYAPGSPNAFVSTLPNRPDWMRAPASIVVNGAVGNGTMLMDTGVPGMFLTAPPDAIVQTNTNLALGCKTSCAAANTAIQVIMPGQTTPIASYNFTLGPGGTLQPGNLLAPLDISVDTPNVNTYVNTTFNFLNGFNYFYDYDNGFVGFQWNGKVANEYGTQTPGIALQGTFAIADGFTTTFPLYLTSNNQAGTPTTLALAGSATFAGVISGTGGLTYAGGSATVTGANTYFGGTTINGGTVSVPADSAFGDPSGGLFLNSGTVGALAPLSSARPIALTGSNAIATNGNAVALSGPITGTGGLAIGGGGTVTLTGVNSYAGPTSVTATTLAVGTGALAGSSLTLTNAALLALGTITYGGALTLAGTSDVINAGGYQVTINGSLSGNAALTTIGNVQVAGDLLIAGAHVVQQGTFVSNGTLSASSLAVASGGTLGGTGTIAAPTAIAGTLAPGNSPGTITFLAPVTQLPGSKLAIDIDGTGTGNGPGNYDRVLVQGAGNGFTAAGTLEPSLRGITGDATNSYTPPIGQAFTIVQAQGGVTGSFDALTQPGSGMAPGSRFDVLYGNTAVTLVVTPASYGNLGLSGLSESAGQAAVGRAIDASRPAAGVALTTTQSALYGPLYMLPGSAIPATLDQLGPSVYGSALMTARDGWYTVTDAIGQHLAATRTTLPVGSHSVWVTSLADFGNTGSNGAVGYSATTAGVLAGVDMRLHENWSAGVAIGYLNLQTSNDVGAQASGDALHVRVYGAWQQDRMFAEAEAGGFAMEGDGTRTLGAWGVQARGDTGGGGGGGSVRVGLRLPALGWQIEPSVRLAGVGLTQGGFTETQAGPLALSVGQASLASVQTQVGIGASRTYALSNGARLVPTARVGWAHEYADQNATMTAAFVSAPGVGFAVGTPNTGRDAAIVGAGVELQFASQLSLHLGYRGAFRNNSNAQEVAGGLRWVW